ncbi:MAG: hypothetical protein ACHREM_04880 [Polyangiales bacterium]
MKALATLAFATLTMVAVTIEAACAKGPPSAIVDALSPDVAASSKSAAATLKGVWRPTLLVATVPGTEASVRAMNEQFGTPAAMAARIEYTGDRIVTTTPGAPKRSAPYTIEHDFGDRVVIHDYRDDVTISFADDDHATIDRKNNPFGAQMRIERVKGEVPPTP